MLDYVDMFEQEWKCEWKVSIRLIYICKKKPVDLIYMDNCICTNKLLIGNKKKMFAHLPKMAKTQSSIGKHPLLTFTNNVLSFVVLGVFQLSSLILLKLLKVGSVCC